MTNGVTSKTTIRSQASTRYEYFHDSMVHLVAGYEFHRNLDDTARTGDGMHVPRSCTHRAIFGCKKVGSLTGREDII